MAKALKTVGAIAAIAGLAIVTGGAAVGLGVSLATSVGGISAGSMLLAGSALQAVGTSMQKMPETPASQTERLNANVDIAAHRKTVLGSTALASDVRYVEWFGANQERCGWIVAHASHRIHSVDEIWLNDELAWTAAGGTQGKFRNYFWIRRVVLEGSAANAFTFGSGKWNAVSSRLTGCAYTHWEFKVTGNSKKTESPFASGIPTRVTVIGKGAPLYDPRRDSTVAGGSGPMRADDQSTWRFVADDGAVIGDNLSLQVLRTLLGWKISGKLAVGCGVPVRRLGLPSFAVAANQCDEPVGRSAGGTEPRYQGAAVLSEGSDPRAMLDPLLAACSARFRDHGGKLQIAIMHNDLAAASTDDGLVEDDVVGAFTWDPDPAIEQTPNIIRGRYTDPASLYQLVPYPDVSLPSFDGIDRPLTMDLGVVESPSQAQRVVKQFLQRKQYARRFSAPFDITAWRYNVGDIVPLTFAPLSFNRKLFRVVETDPGSNPCQMVLEEETAAIYAWENDDRAPVQPAVPTIYDASNNPLIRAIDDAAETAIWDGVTGPGKPEDGATVGAPPGTSVGGRPVEEIIPQLDRIEPIDAALLLAKSDISALKLAEAGHDRAIGRLDAVSVDLAAADRQMRRDAATIEEVLLRLTSEAGRTREVLRDAGIVVDPDTGTVRIFAVDQLAERTAAAELLIDGTNAIIRQKASVDYVDEQIALAVLDPEQVAQLEGIIARLTSAEQTIDGLNAAIELRATIVELTGVAGRVTTAEQTLDALEGQIVSKVEKSAFDALATTVSSVEQTLQTLGNVAGIAVTIRQARAVADDSAEAALRAIVAGDDTARRQIVQSAEIRQELFTRIDGGLSAEAAARLALAVQMGGLDARLVNESRVRAANEAVTAEQLAALGVTNGQQSAAIGELRSAAIDASGGIAGIRTTIRQVGRDQETGDEALLRAVIEGDRANRARIGQLAQFQSDFTTTLVANEAAGAAARQSLLARMAGAEAASVDERRVRAEADSAAIERIAAGEAVVNDPATGLAATRGRLAASETATASRFEAQASRISETEASIAAVDGKADRVDARVASAERAIVDGDRANADRIAATEVRSGETIARVARAEQATIDGDRVNAELIEQVSVRLGDLGGATVQELIRVVSDEVGRILATRTVAIDINGNIVGTQLVGSQSGRGSFNLINVDLRMGTGRVIFNTGTVMMIQGLGFGARGDLIFWVGPTMSIDECSRSNALMFFSTDLKGYFGGGLSAGVTTNPVNTTSTAENASVTTGQVGSRGGQRVVVLTYEYSNIYQHFDTSAGGSGASSAAIVLARNGVDQVTLNAGGTWRRDPSFGSSEPGNYQETIAGAYTFYDNSGGNAVSYSARLVQRSLGQGASGQQQAVALTQSITIVQTEE